MANGFHRLPSLSTVKGPSWWTKILHFNAFQQDTHSKLEVPCVLNLIWWASLENGGHYSL